MPKVILKSNYIKGGAGAHGKNLVNYIGTRDGVEKHVHKYIDYISNRKGVEKYSNHGLFTSGNSKIILSKVQEEVGSHKGNIWLPIISLTREDAIKTGFDNGTAWKDMLSKIAPKIADYYKIKIDNLCWYASYHDEGYHPHVHMLVYSKNPNEGFLTKKGIEKFKSTVMKEVFSLEMEQVYIQQSIDKNELKKKCKDLFSELRQSNFEVDDELKQQVFELKMILTNHKGKKTYGYLKKKDKEIVDKIVDNLEKVNAINQAYDLWYNSRLEIYAGYSDAKPDKLPLSKQNEFRSIKNMIIEEIDKIEIDLSIIKTDIPTSEITEKRNEDTIAHNHIEISNGIFRVLSAIDKIFTDEIIRDATTINNRIDKKALAKLIERKQSRGQKHTGEDLQLTMS